MVAINQEVAAAVLLSFPLNRPGHKANLSGHEQASLSVKSTIQRLNQLHSSSSLPLPLDNQLSNQFYTASVSFGNEGQSVLLALDTGSSDTWARGLNCKASDGSCDGSLPSIDVGKDSSISPIARESFSKHYGSGTVGAYVYKTKTCLDGTACGTVPIGVAVELTGFNDGKEAGLLGLGYNTISSISASLGGITNANWFDSLGLKGSQNIFSFYLSTAEGSGDSSSSLTIGGYDASKVKSGATFTYFDITNKGTWLFPIGGFTFKVGENTGSMGGGQRNAFADTGCTLMILDTAPANEINGFIGAGTFDSNAGTYPIPCSVKESGPEVEFIMKGKSFAVPASIYVFSSVDDKGATTCYSGFTQGASNAGSVVLGDTFLRAFVSVFDKNLNRIGFAAAV